MQEKYKLPACLSQKDLRRNSQAATPSSRQAKTPKLNRIFSESKLFSATTMNLYATNFNTSQPEQTYLAKIRPKHIRIDKERLYEENIAYKHMINTLSEENTKLKTKISQMDHEFQEKKLHPTTPIVAQKTKSQVHLIENLKNTIKELRSELQTRNIEYEELKRSVRVTKMNEITEELKQYINECKRLKRVNDELQNDFNNPPNVMGGLAGLTAYGKLKIEYEQLERSLKLYQESDKIKTEQIAELKRFINQSDQGILIIDEEPVPKQSYINAEKNDQNIKEINKPVVQKKEPIISDTNNEFTKNEVEDMTNRAKLILKKLQIYLKVNKLQPKEWIEAIPRSIQGILSLDELWKALKSEKVPIDNEEVKILIQQLGENDNQIMCSVFIEELTAMNLSTQSQNSIPTKILEINKPKTISRSDAQTIMEEIQCRLAFLNIKDLKKSLENDLEEDSFTFSELLEIFNSEYLAIENEEDRKKLASYLLFNKASISKQELINEIIMETAEWKVLTSSEIDYAIRGIKAKLVEGYDDLISRIKRKSEGEFIPVFDLIDEMKIYGFISTPEQIILCKEQFFSYEKSMNKVPYLKALKDLNKLIVKIQTKESSFVEPHESSMKINEYEEISDSHSEENKEIIYSQLEPAVSEDEPFSDIEISRNHLEANKESTERCDILEIPEENFAKISEKSSFIEEKIEEL